MLLLPASHISSRIVEEATSAAVKPNPDND